MVVIERRFGILTDDAAAWPRRFVHAIIVLGGGRHGRSAVAVGGAVSLGVGGGRIIKSGLKRRLNW